VNSPLPAWWAGSYRLRVNVGISSMFSYSTPLTMIFGSAQSAIPSSPAAFFSKIALTSGGISSRDLYSLPLILKIRSIETSIFMNPS
jgi:hypothetical protein